MLLLSLSFASEITVDAQVRPRLEARQLGDIQVHAVSQRTRLGATLVRGDLSGRVIVQDVRFWGEEANTLKDFSADNLDFHVASMTWSVGENAALTIGRQEITVHEHRLIGNVGWTQQGRAFDGLHFQKTGPMHLELAGVALAEGDSATWGVNETALMGFARAGWAGEGPALVDLLYVGDMNWGTDTFRHTAGLYARGGMGILSGRAEAYGQFTDEVAYMAGVRGTIAPDSDLAPSVTLWFDTISPGFNTLFATNHKFYGRADIAVFQVGGADTGLHDAALKLSAKPGGMPVNVDGHLFLAADGSGTLGYEADVWTGKQLTEGLNMGLGGAAFIPADGDTALWGFVQLDAKM
jgi:hypothetical protein